ncbi:MAG: hypothetical protein AAF743_08270, partial [Planctomycetota bacterium]
EPDVDLIHDICAVKLLLSMPVDDEIEEALRNCPTFPDRAQVALALDSGKIGGTGQATDWDKVAGLDLARWSSVMLGGGMTPDNVGGVIRKLRPDAVDVSSGIEDGVKGFKSIERMTAFVEAVQAADRANVTA